MNEQELVIYLLGKSEIDKYKKDNAISDLCERHNNLLKQNHDLLIENELANKDANNYVKD